jgi:acetolactate synthase I/III small subunit
MTDPALPSDALLVIYAHSQPGVLAKIASVFYRRGLNIRTLTVGTTHEAELSKIVARVTAPLAELERVAAAIRNLIDVLSVELSELAAGCAHELCLVRVAAPDRVARAAVLAAAQRFAAAVRDDGPDSVVLEVTAAPAAIDVLIDTLAPFPVLDVSRTGATATPGQRAPGLRGAPPG